MSENNFTDIWVIQDLIISNRWLIFTSRIRYQLPKITSWNMARFFFIFVRFFQNRYPGSIFEVIKHFSRWISYPAEHPYPSISCNQIAKNAIPIYREGECKDHGAVRKKMHAMAPFWELKSIMPPIATFVIGSPIIVLLRGSMSNLNNAVVLIH